MRQDFNWSQLDRVSLYNMLYSAGGDIVDKKMPVKTLHQRLSRHIKSCLPVSVKKWQYDAKQQLSRRTRNLAWHGERIQHLVDEALANNGAITTLPEEILLKLDNTCNLKCPTCNQYQSSLHEKEVKLMKKEKQLD